MEEAKDTLWTWAVQLTALAGLASLSWGLWSFARGVLSDPALEMPMGALAATIAVSLALGGVPLWRLARMRRWAAWYVIVVLGVAVAVSKPGAWSVARVMSLAPLVVLPYPLLFRRRIWRGGF